MKKYLLIICLIATSLISSQGKYSFKSFYDFRTKLDSVCNISDPALRNNSFSELWDTLRIRKKLPFTFKDSVAFLYWSSASSVRWAGDFNSWSSSSSSYVGSNVGKMNDVWINIHKYPSNARLDYKIITGGSNWITDPANPFQQYSGVGTYNSELRMPDWSYPQETIRTPGLPSGTLNNNFPISSVNLGYTVYSRVYTPYGYDNLNNLPVIYVTDGHEYSDQRLGSMITILDNLINEGKIKPIIAVFIDPRLNLSSNNNLRGDQYTINKKFADFVADELVPFIDLNYKTNKSAEARAILGTSLGGLNSAYFGIYRADKFHLIGIHSPAFQVKTQIYDMYANSEKLPLKIFMSTGTINDTQSYALQLKSILDGKGYQLQYIEVPEGHSWGNWRALIDNCLIYFFKENIPVKVGDAGLIPKNFVQIKNYPNPFNPQTTIIYSIPQESRIAISVFNILGQKVADLADEIKSVGSYEIDWNASSYTSGVFFL